MPAAEVGLQRGTLIMQLADNQFTRGGGLETFFHKIILIRNNLRLNAPGKEIICDLARTTIGKTIRAQEATWVCW
jgi:hypothetical protein